MRSHLPRVASRWLLERMWNFPYDMNGDVRARQSGQG